MKFHLILFTLAAVLFANPINKYAHSQVMGRSLPKGSVTKVVQTSEEESEEKKDAKEDKYEVNQNNMTEMRYFNNNLFPLIWNNDFNKGKTVVKTSTSLKKKDQNHLNYKVLKTGQAWGK
ncbi:hypothetical protein L0F63_002688 [Massospora cicadina]|nr:hypothetical protein L0F63_002688 [Massospora cicadina]